MTQHVWTEEHFEQMSWHDNHVHALRFTEGEHGAGDLELDIDYILEWLQGANGAFRFRIVAATLVFHEVMFPRILLDYRSATAAFGPFTIGSIERREETRERYTARLWTIEVNWPKGEVTFAARGFTQRSRGLPVVSDHMSLSPHARSIGA